jgi:hypothetical protein
VPRSRVLLSLSLLCFVCCTTTWLRSHNDDRNSDGRDNDDRNNDPIVAQLKLHQFDLSSDGKTFLLEEARQSSFFMIGELHGDREIPELLEKLWPEMWRHGYRHIAAELSPWAANQLEFTPADRMPDLRALWSKQEATFVHSLVPPDRSQEEVLWGCDMDEMQPNLLVDDLAAANPKNAALVSMVEQVKSGYKRALAPELLHLMPDSASIQDQTVNGISLAESIRATLEIESDRLHPETRFSAQQRRESLMKQMFVSHYERMLAEGLSKIMLRFGRNHLHRGYDDRGISTLGNFVSEFAIAHGEKAFNVAAFGAGGKATLAGEAWDADERGDDLAFAFLAALARYPATVFDLRPLRPLLHGIPEEKRTALQRRLIYWADSYDAIICYKNVTPFDPMS